MANLAIVSPDFETDAALDQDMTPLVKASETLHVHMTSSWD